MAARFLDRLKRSLLKAGADPDREDGGPEGEGRGFGGEERWEAELEEDECVTERLRGTLRFDDGEPGGEATDSDSDFEDGLSSTDASPVGVSPVGSAPSALLTRQLQHGWRSLCGLRRPADRLLFEVTDASVVQDGAAKYVLYTIHVIQSGGSDKTPAVISRRYSDFQRLHAALRRHHGDQMERVAFPRKKLRRNFTAETIAGRSRAFEQYLSHLCSLPVLRGAPSVRRFFYLSDLQAGQLLIRAERFQEALGPLLNAKRLQHKLGWASYRDDETQAPPPASSHWFFTLVGLACCFQEVEQLEEALEHCDRALRMLLPLPLQDKPLPQQDKPLPQQDKPLPLQGKPLPLQDKPLPLQGKPLPLQDKPLPLQDKPLPQQDKPLPLQDKPLPLQDKPLPLQDKPLPLQDKPLPLQDKPLPLQGKPLPLQDKPLPLQDKPLPQRDKPLPLQDKLLPLQDKLLPLQPLLQTVIRLSWQTGRDKQRWEEHLQQLEGAGPDDHVTLRDFLVHHELQPHDGDG